MNFQHALLRDLLGYTIHPNIRSHAQFPKEAKVADIGTGTGYICTTSNVSLSITLTFGCSQWLIDVSPELPLAQLDGFDISEEQYPSKAWLPSHITVSQLDITKDIPPNLVGTYDLVHVQLFLCVVQKDGPAAVLEQLYKLLSTSFLQSAEAVLILFVQNLEGTSNGLNTTQSPSKLCRLILR